MLDSVWMLIPVVVFAGLVRGFSGFGFAAIAVVGLNVFLSPQQSIPVVLFLDVLCSVGLWRQARAEADYVTLKLLVLGSVMGIPLGLGLLMFVSATLIKLLICLAILLVSVVLLANIRFKGTDTLMGKLTFGVVSGVGTAGASVGGPIILTYMLSSHLSASTQRATMILFFVTSESIALAAMFGGGLIDGEVFTLILTLLLPTLIAVRMGQWLFNRKPPKSLKHFALPVMVMVALLGISASAGALM